MLLAGVGYLLTAVPFGQHDHATAMRLEQIHVGVHASSCGGSHGSGGIPCGCLCRAGIINRMILHILRHSLAPVDPFLQFRVSNIASHDDGSVE